MRLTLITLVLLGLACGSSGKPPGGGSMDMSSNQPTTTGNAANGVTGSPGSSSSPTSNAGSMSTTPIKNGAAGAASAGTAGTGTSTPTGTAGDMAMDNSCPTCPIPANCRGFSFDGLKYSPGGTTLPNKCMPFEPTLNNPYAVRCIDAIPDFKTKFAGDQYCILPPPPDQGIQVGLHPQGRSDAYWKAIWAGDYSVYENPPAEWVLAAGQEETQNYRTADAPNTMDMNYYRTYFRMRTGSHHMIVTMHDSTDPDGWIQGAGEALPGLFDPSSGVIKGVLGGEQRPNDNTPVTMDKPPEDDGLYLILPASPSIIFNMHHFNITDKAMLREGWINIWWETDARQVVSWYMGLEPTQVITLNVPPNTTADLHYSWSASGDIRVIRVFGHRHFWTTNFSSWIQRASGETELAYQSYDWFDMPTYRYDSQVMNPALDPASKTDGATSGVMMLHAGDSLHFNCHIEYTDARQAIDATHAPKPAMHGALGFANEAYTGEMCIEFGNVTGGSLGLPGIDGTPVPDFAKLTRDAK